MKIVIQKANNLNSKGKELNGFSLLEILIAGTVLAVVLVGLARLLSYTTKSDIQARVRTFAGELAQSRVDFFRQEKNILGWNGLSTVLEDGKYCLNGVTGFSESVENNVLTDLKFTNDAQCPYVTAAGDMPVLIKQVAEVVVTADEINVEIIVSWQNDAQDRVISVKSRFQLRKDTHQAGEFVPVGPSATPPPLSAPTAITAYSWFDGYGSSCIEGQTYYFIIYAYDAGGSNGLGSTQQSISISLGDDTIRIDWSAVVGAAYYRIYMSASSDMSNPYYITAVGEGGDSNCTGISGELPD